MRQSPQSSPNVVRFPGRVVSCGRRRLHPADIGLTCLALTVHDETGSEVLASDCNDAARAVRCPKLMLSIEPGSAPFGFIVATMASSFAQQKGLWPRFIDRAGWSEHKIAALARVEQLAAEKRLRYRGFQQPLPFPGRNAFA